MVILWSSLAALIAINILSLQKGRPAHWNRLIMLFDAPRSVPRYIDLASVLWQQGQKGEARQLMASAQALTRKNRTDTSGSIPNVLGETTDPQTVLAQWEREAVKFKENYAFWQTVVTAKPDYRDAYITLATLAYQLEKLDEAGAWLIRAQALDPNSPTVQEFLNYLP